MKQTPIDSGMLQSAGYDPETKTMDVIFKNGSTYRYRGVPKETHAEFMAAESKGKYLNANIKEHYECVRVEPEPLPAIV